MKYTLATDENTVRIDIDGSLTFEDHNAFRHMIEQVDSAGKGTCIINMQRVSYLDSAALGMLLLLRERLNKRNVSIVLSKANGQVAKILTLSNFGQLFTIEA